MAEGGTPTLTSGESVEANLGPEARPSVTSHTQRRDGRHRLFLPVLSSASRPLSAESSEPDKAAGSDPAARHASTLHGSLTDAAAAAMAMRARLSELESISSKLAAHHAAVREASMGQTDTTRKVIAAATDHVEEALRGRRRADDIAAAAEAAKVAAEAERDEALATGELSKDALEEQRARLGALQLQLEASKAEVVAQASQFAEVSERLAALEALLCSARQDGDAALARAGKADRALAARDAELEATRKSDAEARELLKRASERADVAQASLTASLAREHAAEKALAMLRDGSERATAAAAAAAAVALSEAQSAARAATLRADAGDRRFAALQEELLAERVAAEAASRSANAAASAERLHAGPGTSSRGAGAVVRRADPAPPVRRAVAAGSVTVMPARTPEPAGPPGADMTRAPPTAAKPPDAGRSLGALTRAPATAGALSQGCVVLTHPGGVRAPLVLLPGRIYSLSRDNQPADAPRLRSTAWGLGLCFSRESLASAWVAGRGGGAAPECSRRPWIGLAVLRDLSVRLVLSCRPGPGAGKPAPFEAAFVRTTGPGVSRSILGDHLRREGAGRAAARPMSSGAWRMVSSRPGDDGDSETTVPERPSPHIAQVMSAAIEDGTVVVCRFSSSWWRSRGGAQQPPDEFAGRRGDRGVTPAPAEFMDNSAFRVHVLSPEEAVRALGGRNLAVVGLDCGGRSQRTLDMEPQGGGSDEHDERGVLGADLQPQERQGDRQAAWPGLGADDCGGDDRDQSVRDDDDESVALGLEAQRGELVDAAEQRSTAHGGGQRSKRRRPASRGGGRVSWAALPSALSPFAEGGAHPSSAALLSEVPSSGGAGSELGPSPMLSLSALGSEAAGPAADQGGDMSPAGPAEARAKRQRRSAPEGGNDDETATGGVWDVPSEPKTPALREAARRRRRQQQLDE